MNNVSKQDGADNGVGSTGGSPSVAALYVQEDGAYYGLPHVDPWPEARDARLYAGSLPVVAHPPCQRWGKMWAGSPSYIARTGIRKKKGDDGGCFAAALAAVRRCGGVLEHPWGSHAWKHFGIAKPPRAGGWIKADDFGGWTCCVEQGQYGHWMRKPTLLYANGTATPELRWGITQPKYPQWAIDRYGLARVKRMGEIAFKGGGTDSAPRIHTPTEFRDLLIGIALSANTH
jgi:hypothetical protein